MKFLSKIEAKTDAREKEIKQFAAKCKTTRWRHFTYTDIKKFPSIDKWYKKLISDFTSGEISVDEFSNCVGYTGSEIAEAVFDQEGYDLYESLIDE